MRACRSQQAKDQKYQGPIYQKCPDKIEIDKDIYRVSRDGKDAGGYKPAWALCVNTYPP